MKQSEASNYELLTRKQIICNDQSNVNYAVGNEIISSTEVLKSNLCNFNDTYILVTGDITILGRNGATQAAFKNCVSFTKCITKIDRITIGDAEVSDLVMLLHNLIEYSSNYSDTTGSLQCYSKDEVINFSAGNACIDAFIPFNYRTKLL